MSPVAGPFDPTTPARSAGPGERGSCPDCGAPMAGDQRYCLACGHRRGEPRLPFMTAAGFTDAPSAFGGRVRTPPPPPAKSGGSRRCWNPNAVLVVGVAALLLAIGLGFQVGRTLNGGAASGGRVTEKITIENGGESQLAPGEAKPEGHGPEGNAQPGAKSHGESPDTGNATPSKKPSADEKSSKIEEEELEKRTNEVIHGGEGTLAKPKTQVGDPCEPGTARCGANGIWEGDFFGPEE